MQSSDEGALLREFVEDRSDAAFAALVTRHINLVYSVALRHVGDPHEAEEIAQAVFILLAKKAAGLRHDKALSSWLFQATRLTASNFVRSETRRHRREQEAHMQSILDEPGNDAWRQIAPLLDTAVASLSEKDRHAIVLRYYEGRNLRDVGAALDASEDAAEKRVSRAVERLREFFARHGVRVGASGLVVVLSANAVQAAPAGLAVTISTATSLAGASLAAATVTATKAIAMTTIQKALIGATVAVLAGAGIYQARQASAFRIQAETLRRQQTPLTDQVAQLTRARDDTSAQLASLREENERLNRSTAELLKLRGEMAQLKSDSQELAKLKALVAGDQTLSGAASWKDRVNRLKLRLEQTPEARIPELQFVTEKDWLNAAKGDLETDADYRRAFSTLRSTGENKVGMMLKKALASYLKKNNKQFPTDLAQLQPYFDSPLDDAILQRWQIAPAATVKSLGMGGDMIITQKAAVDEVFDTRYGIGPAGSGSTDFLSREVAPTMNPVWDAFRAAHNGEWPDDVTQLRPYVTTPEQQSALQKLILRQSGGD